MNDAARLKIELFGLQLQQGRLAEAIRPYYGCYHAFGNGNINPVKYYSIAEA